MQSSMLLQALASGFMLGLSISNYSGWKDVDRTFLAEEPAWLAGLIEELAREVFLVQHVKHLQVA